VTARVRPSLIEIVHDGECVARHQRNYGRGHQILNLEHYLDVLEKKPGAMADRRHWSSGDKRTLARLLDRIWKKLEERHGKSGGTREMIGLVRVGLVSGWDRLNQRGGGSVAAGVTDEARIAHHAHAGCRRAAAIPEGTLGRTGAV